MTIIDLYIFWLPLISLFFLGCIIGSFLGVVSYRLHTGRSLNGSSHCESCGHRLRFYELFPVISYLVLRGRCRECGSLIPRRHLYIELLTGALFVLVGFQSIYLDSVLVLLDLLLVSLLVVVFVYDIRHMIIPDELVVMIGLMTLGIFLYQKGFFLDYWIVLESLIGAVIAGGTYGALWWITGGRGMGLGDAKLALPLGFLLGIYSTLSFIILSFWIGAVVSMLVILVQKIKTHFKYGYSKSGVEKNHRYLTMKSEIPFAPFIIAAFLAVYITDINVFELTAYVLTLFINL